MLLFRNFFFLVLLAFAPFIQASDIFHVCYYEKKGNSDGLDLTDYLYEITQHSNLKFDFIENTREKCLKELKAGEIDFIGDFKTPPANDQKLYSKALHNSEATVIYIHLDDTHVINTAKDLSNLKIGVIQKTFHSRFFHKFAKRNHITYKQVNFADTGKATQAFHKKDIDALVAGSQTRLPESKKAFSLSPTQLYLSTNRLELMDSLNTAIAGMKFYSKVKDPNRVTPLISSDSQRINAQQKQKILSTVKDSVNSTKSASFSFPLLFSLGLILMILILMIRHYKKKLEKVIALNSSLKTNANLVELNCLNKDKFFSRISYEIRTQLNTLQGYSMLAQHNKNNKEKLKSYHIGIQAISQILSGLTSNIIDITSIEQENITLRNVPFNLQDCISSLQEILKFQSTEKSIQFFCTSKLSSPYLVGDFHRLNQILQNLLSNVISQTPFGNSIHMEIESRPLTSNRCIIRFTLQNTNYTMPEGLKEQVLQPLKKNKKNSLQKYQISDLRFFITKYLIQLFEGSLSIDTTNDTSTRIIIDIPFKLADENEYTYIKTKTKVENFAEEFQGLSVLMAEDNKINMDMMTDILRTFGISVTPAGDGIQAVDLFLKSKPKTYDLILMDIEMPRMTGLEACRQIRKSNHPEAKSIPIIALSANAQEQDMKASTNAGMNDHLSKPFNMTQLTQTLKKYMAIEK